jgi:hypothetical protein
MAEFSKQYCETHDMGFDGDFDVYEIWNNLQEGYMGSYICEGFGFIGIGKLHNSPDTISVFIPDSTMDSGRWVDFEEMVLKAKNLL